MEPSSPALTLRSDLFFSYPILTILIFLSNYSTDSTPRVIGGSVGFDEHVCRSSYYVYVSKGLDGRLQLEQFPVHVEARQTVHRGHRRVHCGEPHEAPGSVGKHIDSMQSTKLFKRLC